MKILLASQPAVPRYAAEMTPDPALVSAYRAPMRSPEADDGSAAEWAVAAGIVGLNGAIRASVDDLDEVLAAVDRDIDERTARRIQRFAQTPTGSLVWTRDTHGGFHLGRLCGDWRYDPSGVARRLGLPHQRACDWAADPVPEALVPLTVIDAFARGGRNWQRIRAAGAGEASSRLWSHMNE